MRLRFQASARKGCREFRPLASGLNVKFVKHFQPAKRRDQVLNKGFQSVSAQGRPSATSDKRRTYTTDYHCSIGYSMVCLE